MIDELEAWRLRGLRRASALGFAPEDVNEAAAIIANVFGDRWLADACQRKQVIAMPTLGHPIGELLAPPGDPQIVGLLELVEYLKFAASSPVFDDLINGLKAQYGPTFLQLAMGPALHG
jgi:hypothetical protein